MTTDPVIARQTAAIASGDAEAFAAFYAVWFDRVVIDVQRFTARDESFALDVAQEVMLVVVRRMVRLESEAQLRAWLRRVALRRAISVARADARRRRREHESAATRSASPDDHHERPLERAEWERWLAAALEGEGDDAVSLVEARFRFGWTLSTIGARLNLSASAVDGRITRTLRRLKPRSPDTGDVAHARRTSCSSTNAR